MKTIGLLLIATGKYDQFVEPLLDSVQKHFFNHPKYEVNVFIFSDKHVEIGSKLVPHSRISRTYRIPIDHKPWPYATLYRYKYFSEEAHTIRNHCDYVFYVDVDALFIKDVGPEILPDGRQPLLATRHSGFADGGWGSPNNDPNSTAFVPKGKWGDYYMGGFQGGQTDSYLNICKQLAENIQKDEAAGITAEWHDESHWNHFLSYNKHMLGKELPPTFFMAEETAGAREKASILALLKDHEALRSA